MAKVVKPPAAPAGQNRPAVAVRPAAATRKQPAKPAAASRLGRLSNLGGQSLQKSPAAGFFRESFAELKKVHWPTREQTMHMTVIVIVFSLVTGIVLGGLDFIFAQVIGFLVGAG